jgi:hypothetical protein
VAQDQPFVEKCFVVVFNGDKREHVVTLNEEAVYKSIYTDEDVYTMFGKEVCLVIDIALAKGGPESIVESYYSTMCKDNVEFFSASGGEFFSQKMLAEICGGEKI